MMAVRQNDRNLLYLMEWCLALIATGLFTITEVYNTTVVAGMGVLALFFALRVISGRLWPQNTGLEIPAFLFLSSAAVATFISYNQGGALLQFARILAALGLFTLVVQSRPDEQRWLGIGFIIAAILLAVYWPLQTDFSTLPVKVKALHDAGMWIENNLPDFALVALTGPSIHPAVAAGVLLLALPVAVALALDAWNCRRRMLSGMAGLSAVVILAAILLTSIRGAWLALAAMAGLTILIIIQRRWFHPSSRKRFYWGLLAGLGILTVVYVIVSGRLADLLGAIPDPSGTVMARMDLWRQGVDLIQSYPYTGSGLASFYYVHAIYGLLLHTPFIQHAHNTFIQIWFEQGILGALAVLWGSGLVVIKAWRALDEPKSLMSQTSLVLGWAGLIMLIGHAFQGLVDVTMYIERTLPLYGLTIGFAWLIFQRHEEKISKAGLRSPVKMAISAAFVLLLSLMGLINHSAVLGAWYANLGALSQARLEMNLYNPTNFQKYSLDKVRQSLDLSQAEGYFQRAISWQPAQKTALQRLSEIALSQGEYQKALNLTEKAWKALHRDDVTRLLYGDALVANGQPDKAAQVVQGVAWAESRLMFQATFRYCQNQDFQRCLNAWRTVKMINPYNREADRRIAETEKKIKQEP